MSLLDCNNVWLGQRFNNPSIISQRVKAKDILLVIDDVYGVKLL